MTELNIKISFEWVDNFSLDLRVVQIVYCKKSFLTTFYQLNIIFSLQQVKIRREHVFPVMQDIDHNPIYVLHLQCFDMSLTWHN